MQVGQEDLPVQLDPPGTHVWQEEGNRGMTAAREGEQGRPK